MARVECIKLWNYAALLFEIETDLPLIMIELSCLNRKNRQLTLVAREGILYGSSPRFNVMQRSCSARDYSMPLSAVKENPPKKYSTGVSNFDLLRRQYSRRPPVKARIGPSEELRC